MTMPQLDGACRVRAKLRLIALDLWLEEFV